MTDKETNTQVRSGDKDVSTPERIEQDTNTRYDHLWNRHIAVTTLGACVLIDHLWNRHIAATTAYWVLVSLSIISGIDTSLSPLLTGCLCPYRSSLE
jgi:hypothetical protein